METKVDPNPSVNETQTSSVNDPSSQRQNVVWALTDIGRNVVTRTDGSGFFAKAIRAKLPGYLGHYFLTEKEAIDKSRQYKIETIDRLQAEVNRLDERYDALEEAEMEQGQ